MEGLIERNVNGKRFWVDPAYARRVAFEEIPAGLSGESGVKGLIDWLAEGAPHTPLMAKVEVTSRCNLDCPFCYVHGHVFSPDLAFEEAKGIFDWLIGKGMVYAVLTGGECTLNPDFARMFRYLKERGVLVDVYTNGTLVGEELLGLFRELPPHRVEVSLYALPGERPLPYEAILALKGEGVEVLAKATVARETADICAGVREWCEGHGVALQVDADLFDARDGSPVAPHAAQAPVEGYRPGGPPAERAGRVPRVLNCAAGYCSLCIDSERRMGLCFRSGLRFDGATLDEAYERLAGFVARHRGKEFSEGCEACARATSCRMCLARASYCGRDGSFRPPEGFCGASVGSGRRSSKASEEN